MKKVLNLRSPLVDNILPSKDLVLTLLAQKSKDIRITKQRSKSSEKLNTISFRQNHANEYNK